MTSTGHGSGGGANGANGVNGAHGGYFSRVRTIEELYDEFHLGEEGHPAPPNTPENGVMATAQVVVSTSTQANEVDNAGNNANGNASVQSLQNPSSGGQQGQGGSSTPGGSGITNSARTHQAVGPPPTEPLPTTPVMMPVFADDTAQVSYTLSAQYGRASDILGTTALSDMVDELDVDESSTSVSNSRSARNETYRGSPLSDIIEDPTESAFEQEGSGLSLNSGSTVQPLLPAESSEGSDISSAPSIAEGSSEVVARDNSENSQSLSNTHALQEQDWETTEEEEEDTGAHDQTILNVEVSEVPLPSLPSDTSLLISQNIVSTWDPLSAKNNLHTISNNIFANKLRTPGNTKEKRNIKKGAGFESRFTESLPDKPLPAAQNPPNSHLEAAASLAQPVGAIKKPASYSSVIPLRNLFKGRTPKSAKMSHSSTKSADDSYTTNTEPFPEFQQRAADAEREGRVRRLQAAANIYGMSSYWGPPEIANMHRTRATSPP